MDNYLGGRNKRDYFLSMANIHAKQLTKEANFVGVSHIKDGWTRIRFEDEIRSFIDNNLNIIKKTKSEKECLICVQNLKQEIDNIKLQNEQLITGQVENHVLIDIVKNGDVWGYTIKGVDVIVAGAKIIVGIGMIVAGGPVGLLVGTVLVLHGTNDLSEIVYKLKDKNQEKIGYVRDGYIKTAKFLGFDESVGNIAYYGVDLTLSSYGLFRMVLKPDSKRLFRYMYDEYKMGFKLMTAPELTLEIYGDAQSIKSIYVESKE